MNEYDDDYLDELLEDDWGISTNPSNKFNDPLAKAKRDPLQEKIENLRKAAARAKAVEAKKASKNRTPASGIKGKNPFKDEVDEKVGSNVSTKDHVFAVGEIPWQVGSSRENVDDIYESYRDRGTPIRNPKFYRRTVTIMETLEEISEEEWLQLKKS